MRRRIFILWMILIFYSFMLFMAASIYVGFRLLPNYQDSIQRLATNVTGAEVSFHIDYAGWQGINPKLVVSDLKLNTHDNSLSLDIPKINITLNTLRSMLHLTPVSKGIVIASPVITIQNTGLFDQDALHPIPKHSQESFSIATQVDDVSSAIYALLEALQLQDKLAVRDGVLVIPSHDDQPTLYGFDFQWMHSGRHSANLALIVAPSIGEPITLNADYQRVKRHQYRLAGVVTDPDQRIVHQLNGRLGQVEVGNIGDNGKLSFDALLAQNDLVSLAVIGGLEYLDLGGNYHFDHIDTHLVLSTTDNGHLLLDVQPLSFVYQAQAYSIPHVLFDLYHTDLTLSVPQIDIPHWGAFFDPFLHQWQKDAQISGKLDDVKIGLDLSQPLAFDKATIAMRFHNLSLSGTQGQFDFSGLSGEIHWQKDHGTIRIQSPEFTLGDSFVFTHAWPTLSIDFDSVLSLSQRQLSADIKHLSIRNNVLSLNTHGDVVIPLDDAVNTSAKLKGVLQMRNAKTEYQAFLPKAGIPQPLYDWLMVSIYGGEALDATFDIQGILSDIPYPHHDGTFKIDAQIRNGTISPYFGWGVAHNVNANIHFDNQRMLIHATQGEIAGAKIGGVTLEIPDISPNVMSHFLIHATGQATGENIQAYLDELRSQPNNPLLATYQDDMPPPLLLQSTRDLSIIGDIGFDMYYDIILGADYLGEGETVPQDHYSGQIQLANIAFKNPQWPLSSLYGLSGKIDYDNAKITLQSLHGFFDAGSPFHLSGFVDFTHMDNPAFELQSHTMLPLSLWTHGVFAQSVPLAITAQGNFQQGSADIRYQNILLIQPTPMRTGRASIDWQTREGMTDVDYRSSSVNGVVSASIQKDKTGWHNAVLNADLNELNIQRWLDLAQNVGLYEPTVYQTPDFSVPMVSLNVVSTPPCLLYANAYDCEYRGVVAQLNPKMDIKVNELDVLGYSLGHFSLISTPVDQSVQAQVSAAFGQRIDINFPYDVLSPVTIKANNVFIPVNRGSESEIDHTAPAVTDSAETLQTFDRMLHQPILPVLKLSWLQYLPMLQIQVDDLFLGGLSVPRVYFYGNSQHHQYHIKQLRLVDQDVTLDVEALINPSDTQVSAQINSKDYGVLLSRIGQNQVLAKTSGTISAQLQWYDTAPSLYGLNAMVDFNLADGSIIKLDSNITKFIGLLSLESYLSRSGLVANTEKGLAFNSITGRYHLAQGIAQSDPSVVVATPSFSLLMRGKVDLNQQTLDQVISLQPHFAATTALVVGVVGTPIAGVATYLGSKFLGNTLFKNVGVIGYRVQGSWTDPKMTVQ